MASLTTSPTKSALDPKVLLMSYLKQLQAKPLRTKMATQGSLSALTEIIASYFAYQRPGYGPMITSRVPQMAFYGACIAAPLQHFLMTMAQKQFPGKILLQQLVTMFICFPIQNTVYLSSMAIIAGARTKEQVQGAVKAGLVPMTKAMCAMHPILITFAKVVVPMEYWPVFFSLIGFSLSTFFNTLAKMRRAAAENSEKKDKET